MRAWRHPHQPIAYGWAASSLLAWALDVLTTAAVIAGGGFEANHLAADLQGRFGLVGWAAVMFVPAAFRTLLAAGSRWPLATFCARFAVLLHLSIVAWNLGMLGLLASGY